MNSRTIAAADLGHVGAGVRQLDDTLTMTCSCGRWKQERIPDDEQETALIEWMTHVAAAVEADALWTSYVTASLNPEDRPG